MATLSMSVGKGARNLRDDVIAVQKQLKAKGTDPGAADGLCGPRTLAAILKFQSGFMGRPDGVISPGGPTWAKLTEVAASAKATSAQDWSGDASRWAQHKKLQSMTPLLRPKVQAVLAGLSRAGFQPTIFYGWRSVAVQLSLYKAGNSKVKFSFHNAQLPDGTPNAYAADIIDARYAWGTVAKTSGFWTELGAQAKQQGLYWGGDWASFRDWAHVQLVDNPMLARVKKESGL